MKATLEEVRNELARHRGVVAVHNTETGETRTFMAPRAYYEKPSETAPPIVTATINERGNVTIDPPLTLRERVATLTQAVNALRPSVPRSTNRVRRCADNWEVVKPKATNAKHTFFAYAPGRTL
jgi:hypothetical protein